MAGYVKMGVDDAINSRGPSPSIWKDCPVIDFQRDPAQGFFKFDDFKNSVLNINAAAATDFASGVGALHGDMNWYVYCESDKVADVALQQDNNGVLLLQTDGTDADVTAITTGNNVAGIVNTPTAGNPSELWFEARVKFVTITDADGGAFIGLAQPGEAKDAGGAMAAGGASLSDVDYVGFAQLSGDGDALKYVYNEATSGTAQSGSAQTLVADTWYRLGFKVVKKGYDAEIRFFVDGVDQGDSAAIDISGTNANWPGNTDMDVLLAYVAESGASDGDGIYVDWVAVARKYA
jgi:hypothetical protein